MMLQADAKAAIFAVLRKRMGATGKMGTAEKLAFCKEMVRDYPFRSVPGAEKLIMIWIDHFFDHRLPE